MLFQDHFINIGGKHAIASTIDATLENMNK